MNDYQRMYKWVEKVKTRDNFQCIKCKKKETDNNLIVHHIDESRKTGKLNNNLNNLITLCRPCHAREHNQISNRQDVFELINAGYSISWVAKKLSISRQWVYHLIDKHKDLIDK